MNETKAPLTETARNVVNYNIWFATRKYHRSFLVKKRNIAFSFDLNPG